MAEPAINNVVRDNFLTCTICMDIFKTPKILPCLHTFCLECIQKVIQTSRSRDEIACPECTQLVHLSTGGAEGIKTNVYVSNLVEVMLVKSTENVQCAFCILSGEKKTPSAKCLDCGDALCQECAERHTLTRLTSTHKVITIEDLQGGRYDNDIRTMQEIPCSVHDGELIKFFCDSCNIPVCRDCILLEHQSHACLKPADVLKSRLPVLGSRVDELDKKFQRDSETQKQVAAKSSDYDMEEEKLVNEIQTAADGIIQRVLKEKEEAIEKVKNTFKCQRKEIEIKKEEVDSFVGITGSSLNFCKTIIKDGKELEILCLERLLHERLDFLRTENERLDLDTSDGDSLPVLTIKGIQNDNGELGLFSVLTENYKNPTFVKIISVRGPDDKKEPAIQDMARFDEDSIIIADMANQNLKIISNEGIFQKLIAPENFSPKYVTAHSGGIAASSNASLLLLSREGEVLHKISLLESARDSHPLAATTIAQSIEGTLACNIDRMPNPSITILDNEGNKLKQIKTPTNILPIYVTVNSRGHTIVSDWIGNCIRIIDVNGKFKNTYCPDLTKEVPTREGVGHQNWRPGSVAVDKSDRIYVADYDKRKVRVLSASGRFLHEVKTEMRNIDRPRALTVGHNDLLFVAGKTEFVNIYKIAEA